MKEVELSDSHTMKGGVELTEYGQHKPLTHRPLSIV